MIMLFYSFALALGLTLAAPWWLTRMLRTKRYREGLGQRLGRVPQNLVAAVEGRRVVWVHAVSVGEVIAATRLVAELETTLGSGWVVVVSTTTRTGQELARERFGSFGAERVFYFPLDFAFATRAYLRALKPAAVVLMESELWPRMLHECSRVGTPVIVANARVSDRSFARAVRFRSLWSGTLRKVSLWLAQSDQDAGRLLAMGAGADQVRSIGNLKYEVRLGKESGVAELIKKAAAGRPIIVAGSTVVHEGEFEDVLVARAWRAAARVDFDCLLVIAPRHPENFEGTKRRLVYRTFDTFSLKLGARSEESFTSTGLGGDGLPVEVIVLDTIGDLAAVYGVADIAFVGGSLVAAGGHNPLEPAQFGVPVIMGPFYTNFRDIVRKMQDARGIRIVADDVELEKAFVEMLGDRPSAKQMGQRGRSVFEEQQGATGRAVESIVSLLDLRRNA